MGELNPFLCPNHQCEMEEIVSGRYNDNPVLSRICPECKFELYNRITKLKEKAAKLRRNQTLARFPTKAKMFEGLN